MAQEKSDLWFRKYQANTTHKKVIFKKIRHLVYYQKLLIHYIELKAVQKNFQSKIPIWIGYASLDEIKELNRNPQMDLKVYPWKFLKEKIESGTWKCIVAKSEDNIVGYDFWSTKEMSFAGTKRIEFDLPPNSAYGFREFVHPNFRNLSIGKQLEIFCMEALMKEGIKFFFGSVNSTNKIQINNFEKIGGPEVFFGSLTFIKSRFFNKVFVSKSIYKAGLKIRRIYS